MAVSGAGESDCSFWIAVRAALASRVACWNATLFMSALTARASAVRRVQSGWTWVHQLTTDRANPVDPDAPDGGGDDPPGVGAGAALAGEVLDGDDAEGERPRVGDRFEPPLALVAVVEAVDRRVVPDVAPRLAVEPFSEDVPPPERSPLEVLACSPGAVA